VTSLVLGGGGFIGGHLCEALLAAGERVRVLERPRLKLDDTPELRQHVEWHEGDFTNPVDVAEAIAGCDKVYHLISTTLPKTSNDNPVYDLESNVAATLRLLELIRQANFPCKIIFVSSGGTVYGNPQTNPIPESHPTDPICAYGISKLAIEKYLGLYHRLHGIDYIVLRLANPYGEGQRFDAIQGAIPVFMHKALANTAIDIWGDGGIVRDYIHIADVSRALLLAASYKGSHHIFNIGSGKGTNLNELLHILEQLLGRPVRHRLLPARSFDAPMNILDVSKAQHLLQWQPEIALRDGMARLLQHMQRLF